VTATDSVIPAITGTEDVTISAAQVASLKVVVSPNQQQAYAWKFPAGLISLCTFLDDAYGNHVTSNDTLQLTQTDPLAHFPTESSAANFPPHCPIGDIGFTTQGQQTVTAVDPSIINPSTQKPLTGSTTVTVTGPVAVDDKYSFLDPTHSALSVYALNALQNDVPDAVGGFLNGNGMPTVFYSSVTRQPEYTDASNQVHQVGLLSTTDAPVSMITGEAQNIGYLSWDLNPAVPPPVPPGVIYDTCPTATSLTSTACNISSPITATYTVTDGLNISAPATITMNLTTPSTAEVIPNTPPVVSWQGGGGSPETVAIGGQVSTQITVGDPATSATIAPDPINSGSWDVSMSYTPTIVSGCTAGCTDLSQCTICPDTVTVQATAVVPAGLGISSTGSATPVLASVDAPLFTVPASDLWHSRVPLDSTTLNWSINLINPQLATSTEVPPTVLGQIFGAGTLSCAFEGQSTACPNPLISFSGGGVLGAEADTPNNCGCELSQEVSACDGGLVFCGDVPVGLIGSFSLQPSGSAPHSWSLSSGPLPVDVDLFQISPNASGIITLNVFSIQADLMCPTGLSCNFSTYTPGFAGNFIAGTQDITTGVPNFSVTFPSTGYWAVQANYSGDANNDPAQVATVYNVTN
jgi:hypothetical protein